MGIKMWAGSRFYREKTVLEFCEALSDWGFELSSCSESEERVLCTRILSSGVFHWFRLTEPVDKPASWEQSAYGNQIAQSILVTSEMSRLPSRLGETLFMMARQSELARRRGMRRQEQTFLQMLRELWTLPLWREIPKPRTTVRIPNLYMEDVAQALEEFLLAFDELRAQGRILSIEERTPLEGVLESRLCFPLRLIHGDGARLRERVSEVVRYYNEQVRVNTEEGFFNPLNLLIHTLGTEAEWLRSIEDGESGEELKELIALAEGLALKLSQSPIHLLRP